MALLLRTIRLDFQPLWWDEGYSVWFANQPLADMLRLTALDIHPPLYYALLGGWSKLFGLAPVALRLSSLVAGLLAVPLIYWLGRRLAGPRAGLVAAFLLAISPFHIFYSQEVRMYALAALWSLLAVGMAAMGLGVDRETGGEGNKEGGREGERERGEKDGRSWWLVGYVVAAVLGLYTLYYCAFLVPGIASAGLWVLWRRGDLARRWSLWLGAQGLAVLFYLPWLFYAAPRLVPYVSQKVVADSDRPLQLLAYLARHLAAFNIGHLEGPLAPWWPLGLLGLLPPAWALINRRISLPNPQINHSQFANSPIPNSPIRQFSPPFLAIILAIVLIAGWLVNLTFPFFPDRGERLMLIALPVWLLLVALALVGEGERERGREREGERGRAPNASRLTPHASRLTHYASRITPYVLLAVLSLAAFYAVPRYAEEDYRPLIGQVRQWGRPEDTVFAVFPWQVGYFWSYGPADPSTSSGRASGPQPELSPLAEWGPEVAQALDAALARGRVWFPEHLSLGGFLEKAAEEYLAGQAHLLTNRWYSPSTRLTGWAAPSTAERQSAAPVTFGNGDRLAWVSFGPAGVEAANDTLFVELSWQSQPADSRHITLRFLGPDGLAWAQQDYSLRGGSGTDAIAMVVLSGTPPGRYDLRLAVAVGENGPPLDVLDAAGQPAGSEANLGMVTVGVPATPPSLETLAFQEPLDANLAGRVRLVGFSAGQRSSMPGEDLKVSLFWQTLAAPNAELFAFVQLLDGKGQVAAAWEGPPVAWHPASAWQAGELLRSQHVLRLPAVVADGNYRLIAGLFDPATGERLLVRPELVAGAVRRSFPGPGKDHVEIAAIQVAGREHAMTPSKPQTPLQADLAGLGRLVGYDLPAATVGPAQALDLTLHWQATGATGQRLKVFIHLLDEAGNIIGQSDQEPGAGAFPTSSWLPGEFLADRHSLTVPADAPAGTARLVIGLYDPKTGQRLPWLDAAGQPTDQPLLLQTVEILEAN